MAPRGSLFLLLASTAFIGAFADPSAILTFNNEAQQAVRDYGIPSQISSRLYAVVHVAQYQAINGDSSVHPAQAAYAGHTVLNLFYPQRFARLDKALRNFTTGISETKRRAAEERGRDAGIAAVQSLLEDGFDRYAPFTPSPAGGPVGVYQLTPNVTALAYPQIATTQPLVLTSPSQFKAAPPLKVPSAAYSKVLAEVFDLGRKASTTRSTQQTDTANFWADGNLTSAVSGHWNQIAQAVLPPSTSTLRAALLFAQLNAAQWDASIAAYRQKYADKFWRPITAINQGDASNPTLKDATWVPFLSTPAHPEHPSGHSATSGASAAVLESFFGKDNVSFTIGTEFPGLTPRSYSSFSKAAKEVSDSRVYAGVHFRHSVEQGTKLGKTVGFYIYKNFKSKIPRN
ncbi:hypothetical protein D9Q98_004809 [Chlorella vulgaris]|uniref:Phosphatidic acid phosphatase type 2/haloperoxidase domain-containing protein n=1 Tax=Chlorella vulgaris TaxID=3077 RepID=A0A9D4YWD9_CHLVU|nr:hypothetical protein D9Q98_004809 [Chlorella vulgaris]